VRSDISKTTYIDVINFSAFSVAMARSSYIRLVPETYGSMNKSIGLAVSLRFRVSVRVLC